MKAVLDASALLAFLHDEPGGEAVRSVLADACISTVNWAETMQKAMEDGADISEMRDELESMGLTIHDFTAVQAEIAAVLRIKTKKEGLSLGDRACLSLAIMSALPVMTTDRQWAKSRLPVKVELIRP